MPSSGKLVSLNLKTPRTIYIPSNRAFTLGRDKETADHIIADISISGVHCTFETRLSGDGDDFIVYVRDSSRNGTLVDSKAVDAEKKLLPKSCELKVGRIYFQFQGFTPRLLEAFLETDGEVLGRGAYGVVRQVKKRDGQEFFAVKYLSMVDIDSVVREVQVMRNLRHDNIVRLFGALRHMKDICLVMELAPLGNLKRFIEASTLSEEEAAPAASQICAALSYLHGKQIMHRDIKPENILMFQVDPVLVVKIADFGLARVLKGDTIRQSLCGTPIFMAPEVVMSGGAGSSHYDLKSDSWSLGVVIYFMLAGRPPYDRRDLDVYAPRDDRRPSFTTLPEGTSAGALDVLTKLVVRDPNRRVSASQIADHPWFSRQVASFPSEQHVEHLLYESIMTHPSYV